MTSILYYQKKRTFSQLGSVAMSGPELATPACQWKKTAFGRRVVSDEGADYTLSLHNQNPLALLAEVPQPLTVEKKETEERTKLLENLLEVVRRHEKDLDRNKKDLDRNKLQRFQLTARAILDTAILRIDPETTNSGLDRVDFFVTHGDELLSEAGITDDEIIETVIEVTGNAGVAAHIVTVQTACDELQAVMRNEEMLATIGISKTTVKTITKLVLLLANLKSIEDPVPPTLTFDGTFPDWRKSIETKNTRARERAFQAKLAKGGRAKIQKRLDDQDVKTAHEFSAMGFSFGDDGDDGDDDDE
ncbi:hypothetical protein FN846DRAFT_970290 [Sphaerosporella brunnea]|uniref:Uncharacterized protein n=1 Tax=Sphaerosporella brunnea TaxID=1250544 RepID=A0A5J5EJA9_9PEZI|nr:hypothetical protein FN846DRAFT_970290 [Sphaerosporella brunnea]